jgi:hypothetical protein
LPAVGCASGSGITITPPPNEEVRIAREVRDGHVDLGWIAAGGWDALGVESFQALQAPFLITDYGLMDAVARSALTGRMLAGLDRYGVVGLALVPGTLLHPSAPRPLLALSSYRGVRFLVVRWRTTGELISALGAKPGYTLSSGGPGGLAPLQDTGSNVVTGNVVLHARLNTLFANPEALARLSDDQRTALRDAARDLVRQAMEARRPSGLRLASTAGTDASQWPIRWSSRRSNRPLARSPRS